jgi:hypothetical protein
MTFVDCPIGVWFVFCDDINDEELIIKPVYQKTSDNEAITLGSHCRGFDMEGRLLQSKIAILHFHN